MRTLCSTLWLLLLASCSSGPSSNHLAGPGEDTSAAETIDATKDVGTPPIEVSLSVGVEIPADALGTDVSIAGIVDGHLPHGILLSIARLR